MLSEIISAGCRGARAGLATILILAGTAVAAQAAGGSVAAAGCRASGQPVEVEMVVDEGTVVLDRSHDKLALTTRFHGDASRMTTGGWTTVGLTESSLQVRTATRTATWSAPGGGYCAELQAVRVDVGYPELRVYIPAEYRPGSCAHETVHAHELEHVDITRAVLKAHAPRLEAAVERSAATLNPMWAPSLEQAKALASARIQAALKAPMDALRSEHGLRNAAIDTAHNYDDLQSRCPAW